MSMFDKLKKLFVVEDEAQKSAEPTSTADAQPSAPKASAPKQKTPSSSAPRPKAKTASETVSSGSQGSSTSNAKPDKKFIDVLLKAIEKNNLEGFDYLEFKNALQNLSSVQMDEATRYKSAMAMATTMGKTSKDIVQSAEHYLEILKKENEKFKLAVENQRQVKIKEREQEYVTKKKMIAEKQKQIEKLQKEIATDTASLDKIKTAINKEAAKVQATHDGFVAAYALVVNQIVDDVNAIKKNV